MNTGQTAVRKKHYVSWTLIIQIEKAIKQDLVVCCLCSACVRGLLGFLEKDFSTDTENVNSNQHITDSRL